ncbi:glycoside hydrolase family 43 protein [Frondihabitans cladoniiphilus]|uniref:Glycoside hydrolase 43 family protein n=1 Tax=Frondihabitans cladoniiphilus TaxID=715785 RepID=A0ABP8W6F7_9MICO
MPTETYTNPILDSDWPDLDVLRVGETYWLVASSSNRVPGLPLLTSPDLVNWTSAGHALPRLEPEEWFSQPRLGGGIWAPSLRFHDGEFLLFVPDPDQGLFVLRATDPAGEWSRPELLYPGLGLIDPCPLWTDDGRAWLVFAWARSRSGRVNRLDVVEMSPDSRRVIGTPVTVVEGADIEGCSVLEGPKLYERDGWYWIFAPAGGVREGWQYAFRSRSVAGPYEHRVVLATNDTDVNGPHQGAWVTSPEGEDWFLHFQDRGVFGRVAHLQPMTWSDDGWPVIGDEGSPVREHEVPVRARGRARFAPERGDDFTSGRLGDQWHWQANPGSEWSAFDGAGTLRLGAVASDTGRLASLGQVLGQSLPGTATTFETTLAWRGSEPGSRAGTVVLGGSSAWIGVLVGDDGRARLTVGSDDQGAPERRVDLGPVGEGEVLGLRLDSDDDGRVDLAFRRPGDDEWTTGLGGFRASEGQWISAQLGLFAASPAGSAGGGHGLFGPVAVTGRSV